MLGVFTRVVNVVATSEEKKDLIRPAHVSSSFNAFPLLIHRLKKNAKNINNFKKPQQSFKKLYPVSKLIHGHCCKLFVNKIRMLICIIAMCRGTPSIFLWTRGYASDRRALCDVMCQYCLHLKQNWLGPFKKSLSVKPAKARSVPGSGQETLQ